MKPARFFALLPLFLGMLAVAQGATGSQINAESLNDKILLAGTVPSWIHNAEKLRPVNGQKRVAITAYLHWRSEPELQQLIEDQTTPREPALRPVFDACAFPRSILADYS